MDLCNTNRLRVSVRLYSRDFAERFADAHCGSYKSGDHGMPRLETNWYAQILGVVVHVKWRPDGKIRGSA